MTFFYGTDGKRLLTFADNTLRSPAGPVRVAADSSGKLPLPLTLASAEQPLLVTDCTPLPDGGFLAVLYPRDDEIAPVLRRYSGEGACLWEWPGRIHSILPMEDRVFVVTDAESGWQAHCLTLAGREVCSAALPCGRSLRAAGAYLYQMDDAALHRFTLDLRQAGRLAVPSLCDMDISPDGSLLVCAGYDFGLVTASTEDLEPIKELHDGQNFCTVMMDSQNRIWVHDGVWLKCYSAGLDLLSCHRLPGDILTFAPAREGALCLAVHQQSKYRTRVYHAF